MKHAKSVGSFCQLDDHLYCTKEIDKTASDLLAFCQKCNVRKLKFYAGGENEILHR